MNLRARVIVLIGTVGVLFPSLNGLAQTILVVDDATLPRFEVASVKPGNSNADRMRFGIPPGRFVQEDASLLTAVYMAFNLRPYQVRQPLPDLVTRERFTIDARMPANALPTDRGLMVRALLIDRFKLRYHIETKEQDGFVLTVQRRDSKLGPALHASSVDCEERLAAIAQKQPTAPSPPGAAECGIRNGPGSINFGGLPLAVLVQMLSNQVGAPVADETGLSGNYDVQLRFALASGGAPRADGQPPVPDDAPSIFTAVQEQLGLKLTPGKARVDTLVIDHIERPDSD